VWDYVLAALTTFLPFLDPGAVLETDRRAELSRLLDTAVMVHRTVPRNHTPEYLYLSPALDEERETSLELARMELMSGYFEKTCVYEAEQVRGLRMMMAYADVLRVLGYADSEIEEKIIARAGADSGRVRQMVDYIGLDGIDHLICVDYMRERLREGMSPEELRAYIDRIEPTQASSSAQSASPPESAIAATTPSKS